MAVLKAPRMPNARTDQEDDPLVAIPTSSIMTASLKPDRGNAYLRDIRSNAEHANKEVVILRHSRLEQLDQRWGRKEPRALTETIPMTFTVDNPAPKPSKNVMVPISLSRGLGDSVRKVMSVFRQPTKDCNCKSRQKQLNQKLPYSPRFARYLSKVGL